ncbi:MAG: glucokinase [Pseudomonadota bacterium]|nr:glucokinase [Pseudomonadota bacterium]
MVHANIGAKPHYLVGDIGGTNARFAYVTPEQARPQTLAKYRVADFQNFDEVMARLINEWQELGLPKAGPEKTCLAVAAPPNLETISFTNSPWRFNHALLTRHLINSSIEIINDFAAVARALPALSCADVEQIGVGVVEAGQPMVSIGPGTGTGVASVIFDQTGAPLVLQGEGGHVDFAPITDMEFEVLKRLRARYGRVSIERLLCGAGIVNIYQALAEIRGVQPDFSKPGDIGAAAQQESPLASEAMGMFFAVLGSSAGNLALTTGAVGGVYVAGGIAPRYIDLLRKSDFRARFLAKGRFADYNTNIGTFVITHDDPGLLGAALYLGDKR